MKIALFSNFLNHHQLPLCEEFLKNEHVQFVFVACTKIPAEREKMGYKNYDDMGFVVKAYEDNGTAEQIALTFDACIFGADCERYVKKRMEKGLLSFRYIERIFKKGKWRYIIPKVHKKIKEQYLRYKNNKFYILCASGFTSSDLSFCGFPEDKCFQWGYFPKQSSFSCDKLVNNRSKTEINVLYVGRLLKLKKVDTIINAFSISSKKHANLRLSIVGDGPEMKKLNKLASRKQCYSKITFYGYKSIEETRKIMEQSHILILASNFYEGWGAVVNESMSSACIPICSHSVGCAPVLINDGDNGFIFRKGKVKMLAKKIDAAIYDANTGNSVAKNAYSTIDKTWNARFAVERLYKLCVYLLENKEPINRKTSLFSDGPCSISKNVKNNWVRRR